MIRDAAPNLANKLASRLERQPLDNTKPGKGAMDGWAWWGVQHTAAAVLALALKRRFLDGTGILSSRL